MCLFAVFLLTSLVLVLIYWRCKYFTGKLILLLLLQILTFDWNSFPCISLDVLYAKDCFKYKIYRVIEKSLNPFQTHFLFVKERKTLKSESARRSQHDVTCMGCCVFTAICVFMNPVELYWIVTISECFKMGVSSLFDHSVYLGLITSTFCGMCTFL
jgi:hypothetical protein